MKTVYFDNAATTRIDDRVLEAMLPFFRDAFGNASSAHQLGQKSNVAVEEVREKVARLLGATPAEIIFTSGGTESNNAVIQGVLKATGKRHVVTSAAEHHAVLTPLEHLLGHGYEVTFLNPGARGAVTAEAVRNAIRPETALVSLMHVNNETGCVHDLTEISAVCKAAGVQLHSDTVQSAGKLPLNVDVLGVDFLSISAHKFYGPKGAGLLYVRSGSDWYPWMEGGSQERRRRGGTLNVPGIVGLGKALELAVAEMEENRAHILGLKQVFVDGLRARFADLVSFNGDPEATSFNVVNISFVRNGEGVLDGEMLLLNLDMESICVSNGSACTSGAVEPSHVLMAMGRTDSAAKSSVRFSFGKYNTMEEVQFALEKLDLIVKRMTRGSSRG